MTAYYCITFFIFGIVLGSFYNVVGFRLPRNESLIKPASHCPNCNHLLKVYELIPIFSYMFLGGKCLKCKQKISLYYPIFELASGLLFVLSYLIFGLSYQLIIALVFVSMTLIVTVSDYFYMIISDEVLIIASVLILGVIFYFQGFEIFYKSILNGVIALLIMLSIKLLGDLLFKKESMGGGDIKLMFIIGLVLGWPMALVSIFLASFIALPISIINLWVNKNHIIPFGPFLCVAGLILIYTKIDFNLLLSVLS